MGLSCASCGRHLPLDSVFCNRCGAPVTAMTRWAEYKQVTVLFADVVHSMDIAKAVGAERLREIMAGLLDRVTAVVCRYGGMVDKFTGDGVMAVFGAPLGLEDHAVRACRAALDIGGAIRDLAEEVGQHDGVQLQLRVGLNSGQVIAGDIGSGGAGYTAIGEQVGLAQRMESVAPAGGVMLSSATARLVESVATLGDPELVRIKGAELPVVARRLIGVSEPDRRGAGAYSALVGRQWEMAAVEGQLEQALDGQGGVATVVGSPGIGKSRLAREITAVAAVRGVEVFTTYCEPHTAEIAFHVVTRLLQAATGVSGLAGEQARARLRELTIGADSEDLLLLDDLLGISDPQEAPPKIDPDARRRRLTALVNTLSLNRKSPAVYVIEDAHWIDPVSESMISAFLTVIPHTPSLVVVTYRPEYHGALSRIAGAQTLTLAPLTDSATTSLLGDLLGDHPSVAELIPPIVSQAAGNPLFAHEIVRDLSERGVLHGCQGDYRSTAGTAEVGLPATVQAVIAARIDRLAPAAKRALCAAAVIGTKFTRDLLGTLTIEPLLDDLLAGQFIDQIGVTCDHAYVFHHPLIRTVAYQSQLKSDRAELHRRLAVAIEFHDPLAVEENASLIAEHLQAAGDRHAAYRWHMRAASWATNRDVNAARLSWERAQQIADSLPIDDPDRTAMCIAPRSMLCGIAWRIHENVAGDRFEELRKLCTAAGDKPSLAIAMAGLVMDHVYKARLQAASRLASETMALIESIGEPTLTVGLSFTAVYTKCVIGDFRDVQQWSQRVIDLAGGDASMGNFIIGSPLANALITRGVARYYRGQPGWRDDVRHGLTMAGGADPLTHVRGLLYVYMAGIPLGALAPNDQAMREIEDALGTAQRSGHDHALAMARWTLGLALIHRHTDAERDRGQKLLAEVINMFVRGGHNLAEAPFINVFVAREKARRGDRDHAIPLMRAEVDHLVRNGQLLTFGMPATNVLVETLLQRGADVDVAEAETAIDRLATAPADEDLVMRDIWLLRLRAQLARAHGDEHAYRDYRDRYRIMATDLGFEGHMQWAEAMA